jgi:hypothetical protein
VDLELLTHTEVTQKLKDGWTSITCSARAALKAWPWDVLGGHTMMAHSHATDMIARKLGKTLVAPVLPIAVNATGYRGSTIPQRDPDAGRGLQGQCRSPRSTASR